MTADQATRKIRDAGPELLTWRLEHRAGNAFWARGRDRTASARVYEQTHQAVSQSSQDAAVAAAGDVVHGAVRMEADS